MEKPQQLEPIWRAKLRLWRRSFGENWGLFMESKIGPIGLAIIIFFLLFGLAHPLYMLIMGDPEIYDPIAGYGFDVMNHPSPPSLSHPLGTDPIGRDIMSQLMYSTSREFMLGIIAAFGGVIIATLVGSFAAYFGGFVDTFFMRLADIVMLFPIIAFLVALTAVVKEMTLFKLALILAILNGFGGTTIILKSQALSVKVKPYIEAAKISGGSSFHIIFNHVIPNVLPISFLYMMFGVTSAIFSEAALAWLGFLDVRMSWGIIIHTADAMGYLIGSHLAKYWYLWLPPGLCISLLCAAFYFVGRGLDEVVNPKLRER